MAAMYASLFSSAREEIVMLPYLAFFDERMYSCLEDALARGVKVTIYVPIDSREYVQGALFYDYHRLVEAGFDVQMEYTGADTGRPLLHQKLCVVDGRYTVIGSSNIKPALRAASLNAIEPAILNAISEESTGWYEPSSNSTLKSITG